MRAGTFAALLAGSILMVARPAEARDSTTGPISESDVKNLCDRTGGDFGRAPDGSSYGCSTVCADDGKKCGVICHKDILCTFEYPERAVSSSAIDPRAKGFFQLQLADAPGKDSSNTPGWLGLLGLIGLGGLLGARRAMGTRGHAGGAG